MIKKLLFICSFLLFIQQSYAQETASNTALTTISEDVLSLYPNPSKEFIKITNTSGEAVSFSIFNIIGDEIIASQTTKTETKLSINELPAGVYIVAFYLDDRTITERLIKE